MNLAPAVLTTPAVRLVFGSVGGTPTTLITVGGTGAILIIRSTLDQEVVISLNGGVTSHIHIQPSLTANQIILDLAAAGISYGGTVTVNHLGAAPTAGVITAGVIGRK